jgi:hypothetical protein
VVLGVTLPGVIFKYGCLCHPFRLGFSVGLSCEDWRTSSHFGLESDPCPVGLGIRFVFPSAHVLILLYVSLGDMQQGGSGPV